MSVSTLSRALLQAARLYVITPDRDPDSIAALAASVLRGGAGALQLRHKAMARGELLALARRLRAITRAENALFIVNDHVDIAMLSEADGVHLGLDDVSVASARRVAGARLIIGASASTPSAARDAVTSGADYIGSGPAFATPLKPRKDVIGPRGVADVAASVDVPVFAIGGIDEGNIDQLTAVGVRRVCVIRAVGDADDPLAVARHMRAMLQ